MELRDRRCEEVSRAGARCVSTAGTGDARCPMHAALAVDLRAPCLPSPDLSLELS